MKNLSYYIKLLCNNCPYILKCQNKLIMKKKENDLCSSALMTTPFLQMLLQIFRSGTVVWRTKKTFKECSNQRDVTIFVEPKVI